MQKSKKKKIIIKSLLIATVVFIVFGLYNPLSVTEFVLDSQKIETPVRIALVSDLHSCKYGDNQSRLIQAVINQKPDIICLVGDIFDDDLPDDNAESFIAEISSEYPCYYVTGNHEYWAGEQKFQAKMDILEKYGVVRLDNETETISINGQNINITGVNDPESGAFDLTVAESVDKTNYSILLSHRPEYFDDYALTGVDLVLCGHAHGGQWRIPGILENGLYAPNQGLFPKYTNGIFSKNQTTMAVSRGLAKESTLIPRFFNRPEIVIIEIQ